MAALKPVRVGVVGCGNISGAYFNGMRQFPILQVAACADLDVERAKAKGRELGIRGCSVRELLADPEIEIVVNLTVPKAHAEVNLAAIRAGKSVHVEKPLALTREDGKKTLDAAKKAKVRVGAAPDTFFGGGLQTCRKLIDDGWIGEPVAATAFMLCHGHESWHPSPEFYYEVGGGPMLDMGPYYITALVHLLGPVKRVTASARASFPTRTITSAPKRGKVVKVETPTHIAGVMDFESGAIGTILTSFDTWGTSDYPRIEIYGSEGTLCVPDPNYFGGSVRLWRPAGPTLEAKAGGRKLSAPAASGRWMEIGMTHGYCDNMRGIGVADMACGLRTGRPHRASGDLALHVLDVMLGFLDASKAGRHIAIRHACKRPAALPTGLAHGTLD